MEAEKSPKLIHIASILANQGHRYLFLRRIDSNRYAWFIEEKDQTEKETGVEGPTISNAIQQARKIWRYDSFRTINCGFLYSLPERDEHGINAYFYQMVTSYNSPIGTFFDENLGHNCIVHFASQEALKLMKEKK